jgi:hypothetical protein
MLLRPPKRTLWLLWSRKHRDLVVVGVLAQGPTSDANGMHYKATTTTTPKTITHGPTSDLLSSLTVQVAHDGHSYSQARFFQVASCQSQLSRSAIVPSPLPIQ